MTVSAPDYLYAAGMELYVSVLAARDTAVESPCVEEYNSLGPALLLYVYV